MDPEALLTQIMSREVLSSPSQPLSLAPAPCLTTDEVTEIFPPGQSHQIWKRYRKYHLLLSQEESASGECRKTMQKAMGQTVGNRDLGTLFLHTPLPSLYLIPLISTVSCAPSQPCRVIEAQQGFSSHTKGLRCTEGPLGCCLAPASEQFSNLPS